MKALKNWFFAWIFPWVPKRLLSRFVGVLMRLPIPSLFRGMAIPVFAKIFKINMKEAEFTCENYPSLDAFFTRKLKSGLRPIQGSMIHPADSRLTQYGKITDGELIQAKGWSYSLAEFLGDEDLSRSYEGGSFFTYYLCPADYHRVHSPWRGDLISAKHIPGLLWPVNDWSAGNIKRLFNLNERVVLNFNSGEGHWSLVMVGATNVGHMTIAHDPSIITNRWMWHAPTQRTYHPHVQIVPGDELGIFHLGSTVICVFSKDFSSRISGPRAVKVGEIFN